MMGLGLTSRKKSQNIRIITAYRPCGGGLGGAGTVWEQHQRYYGSKYPQRVINPRDQFLHDLRCDMIKWKAMGDYLIFGMDANEDVRKGDAAALMSSLSMHEAIFSKHHLQSPLATYNQNYQRQKVDGLWVSDGRLEILHSGYTEFGGSAPLITERCGSASITLNNLGTPFAKQCNQLQEDSKPLILGSLRPISGLQNRHSKTRNSSQD
jgi:hypothetical protein